MRIHMLPGAANAIGVSAAACTGPYDDVWDMQFSLLSLRADSGKLNWAQMYKLGDAGHPYSMTLTCDLPPHLPRPRLPCSSMCFY